MAATLEVGMIVIMNDAIFIVNMYYLQRKTKALFFLPYKNGDVSGMIM